ncbi:Txe/YoeB family addiction module toxin [Sinomicrobium soli]|uniref:Txe/YoeB family addiction module toxin n=1 Tax=Sinomicrobium sp. N-1-3-6 TaxID=2219864 RepID=UPI000DCE3E94|nr:Txe/YoeB family addiction module toxin [Sinomicrobium sp. N-1-3-6]RAV30727.1 Txe/YoeB family addiction module toxin [Sinomicrobium sp. N-1-3-6]
MEVVYTEKALKDRAYWIKRADQAIQKKITNLIKSIEDHPYEGIGKPEALKYELSGFWSRRINREHRLIYYIRF